MPAKRLILIIDDDLILRTMLADELIEDGVFHPAAVASLTEAEASLRSKTVRFEAVILDLGLPDGDGGEFCAKLRRQGHKMPIIMLTGSGRETDVVRGLEAGANDYIVKPVRPQELMARLRAQLRSFETSDDAVFPIGPFLFRPAAKTLVERITNRRIHLTNKEVALLRFLHRFGDRVVDHQDLLNEVWGNRSSATTHTLETHVYRLRQKIEWDPRDPRLLITSRRGYRLMLEGNTTEPGAIVPASRAAFGGGDADGRLMGQIVPL